VADAETIQQIWTITLAVFAVVLLVVALLLTLIVRAARDVLAGVTAIWNVGQRIANNTVQIALLDTTNHVAGRILASAGGVAAATKAMRGHAEGCPACPACVLGGGLPR
jgi:hypothetical protein